jgi:hypothetical protein
MKKVLLDPIGSDLKATNSMKKTSAPHFLYDIRTSQPPTFIIDNTVLWVLCIMGVCSVKRITYTL